MSPIQPFSLSRPPPFEEMLSALSLHKKSPSAMILRLDNLIGKTPSFPDSNSCSCLQIQLTQELSTLLLSVNTPDFSPRGLSPLS
ncbi:MAG: hypothetical protein ACE5JP_17765, partial [Candidatus Bipolaricaulia bacterium]